MNDRDELIRKVTILKIVNRALDYAENLIELSGDCLDKKDGVTAKQYWYAGMAFKQFAEEIIDKEDNNKC